MTNTGIIRKLDEMGRIVLPVELRRTLDLQESDSLEIYVEEQRIVLQKHRTRCALCDEFNTVPLLCINDIPVCVDCATRLRALLETTDTLSK